MPAEQTFQAISRTRFLVIGGDPSLQDRIERYLLMQRAPRVFLAANALAGLRIIQDRRSQVGCIIWAGDGGLEFLHGLRSGRWGGSSIKNLKVILIAKSKSAAFFRRAVGFAVNGVIVGMPPRDEFLSLVWRALTATEPVVPLQSLAAAHMMFGGIPILAVPLDDDYTSLAPSQKADVFSSIVDAFQEFDTSAQLVLLWRGPAGETEIRAQSDVLANLDSLTVSLAKNSCNLRLLIDLPSNDEDIPETEIRQQPEDDSELKTHSEDKGRAKALLTPITIGRVITACKKISATEYFTKFIRCQHIVGRAESGRLSRIGHEYHTDLPKLAEAHFGDVDMRKPGQWFFDLLIALDSLFIRGYSQSEAITTNVTVNFRIKTLSTPYFENFLRKVDTKTLTIELSQADIVESYDQLLSVQSVFKAKGIRLGVDNVTCDSLGLINFDDINISRLKLNWSNSLPGKFPSKIDYLKRLQNRGVELALNRIEDQHALAFGASAGIQIYQGHFIDDLLASKGMAQKAS